MCNRAAPSRLFNVLALVVEWPPLTRLRSFRRPEELFSGTEVVATWVLRGRV
jgi:hypothetical protein